MYMYIYTCSSGHLVTITEVLPLQTGGLLGTRHLVVRARESHGGGGTAVLWEVVGEERCIVRVGFGGALIL